MAPEAFGLTTASRAPIRKLRRRRNDALHGGAALSGPPVLTHDNMPDAPTQLSEVQRARTMDNNTHGELQPGEDSTTHSDNEPLTSKDEGGIGQVEKLPLSSVYCVHAGPQH